MLILTRRQQESLRIGDDITVTILSVKGHQVRVGIEAPRSVVVHREEIYARIRADRAAGTSITEEMHPSGIDNAIVNLDSFPSSTRDGKTRGKRRTDDDKVTISRGSCSRSVVISA